MRKSKATEALRVAQDIAAIKTALKKDGYRILKRPKQAAWKITPLNPSSVRGNRGGSRGFGRINGEAGEPNQSYLLTYQPAPSAPGYFIFCIGSLSKSQSFMHLL